MKIQWQSARQSAAAPSSHCVVPRQSGQALVEFSLVIGLFLTIVLTIVALWPVMNAGDAVAMAAASGAHEAAITGGNQRQVVATVRENLASAGVGFDSSVATVEIVCGGSCGRYSPITVIVSVPVKPWIAMPFLKRTYTVRTAYTRSSEVDTVQNGGSYHLPPVTGLPPRDGGGNIGPWIPPGSGGGGPGIPPGGDR